MRIPHLVVAVAVAGSVAHAQPPARRDVRVCAGGDVSLGTNLDTTWAVVRAREGLRVPALPDPFALVEPLKPLVAEAQVLLLNVEGAIGEGRVPRKCSRRSRLCYALRQPPRAAAALRAVHDSATIVGNLANNHAHDAGEAGFAETLRRLGEAGLLTTGADTLATPVPVAGGDTVAVLGFSPWTIAGVRDVAAVRRHVARAAAQYGRVIVTMHIGAEGPTARHTPNRVERFAGEHRGNSVAFARAAVAGGASLVIGHGPHVLRAMEWNGHALVAYSLGNLVTYGPFTLTGYSGRAAILCATLGADGGVRDAVIRSTRQEPPGLVAADPEQLGARDIDDLSRRDFPRTGVRISATGDVLPRP